MIVTITDTNRDDYNKLFIEAYNFLKSLPDKYNIDDEPWKIGFSGLPEYYSHMADFFAEREWQYVLLPLDEQIFSVNLNDRSISVPSNFNKLVSIQNDQLAETLIFEVDRYFDYMDLANTNIYIQWTLPDKTEGATRINMIDLNTPDKIRFAWPLDNNITKLSGQVEFSIRFFRINEQKELIYSLNTSKALINILKAHQPELNEESSVEDPLSDGLFNNVIINSNFADEGVKNPQQPHFGLGGTDISIKDNEGNLIAVTVANLNEDDTLTFYAEATTADTGTLSYKWYYNGYDVQKYPVFDEDNNIINDESFTTFGTVEEKYLQFNAPKNDNQEIDWTINFNGERYYQAVEKDEIIAYEPIIITKNIDNEYLYRRYTTFTVPSGDINVTGEYYAQAFNTINSGNKTLITPFGTNSTTCNLPAPEDFSIHFNVDKFIIDKDKNLMAIIDKKDSYSNYEYSLYSTLISPGKTENNEWNNIYEDSEKNKIEGNQEIAVITPGWYQLEAIASANRTNKVEYSKTIKITNLPEKPVFDYSSINDQTLTTDELNESNNSFRLQANISQTGELYTEGISYEWLYATTVKPGDYKSILDKDSQEVILNGVELNKDTNTLKITKEISETTTFKCIAINNLNGEKSITDSIEDDDCAITIVKL